MALYRGRLKILETFFLEAPGQDHTKSA